MQDFKIHSIQEFLRDKKYFDDTKISGKIISEFGDLSLSMNEIGPKSKQIPHYHKFGAIDFFIVIAGHGLLKLAALENERLVKTSEKTVELSPGDTFCLRPYLIHSMENPHEQPFIFINFALKSHEDLDYFLPKT